MAEHYRKLLEQLAQEHERVLRECAELRARHAEGPAAAAQADAWQSPGPCSPCPSPEAAGIAGTAETDSGKDVNGARSPRRSQAAGLSLKGSYTFEGEDSLEGLDESGRGLRSYELRDDGLEAGVGAIQSRKCEPFDENIDEVPVLEEVSPMQPTSSMPRSRSDDNVEDSVLPVLDEWEDRDSREVARTDTTIKSSKTNLFEHLNGFRLQDAEDRWMHCRCLHAVVMAPGSWIRQSWDALTLLVLSYDVIMLPMQVFVDEDGDLLRSIHLGTASVWTIDVIMNFFTAYYSIGSLETRLPKIASRYLKTWLVPDLGIIMLDWTIYFLESAGGAIRTLTLLRAFKILRLVRFLRLLRLLRVLKFQGKVDDMTSYFRSDLLVTIFGIIRSTGYIMVASHYIACAWYFVGGQKHMRFTWVQSLDDEDRDMVYRYLTSLHWSITQFTPASTDVQPRNWEERLFAICVILSGMIAFSCFVSSITQAMAHLQRQHAEESKQQAQMRRFFIENHVSFDVGTRVTRFVKAHKITEKRRIYEGDVVVFGILPEAFKRDLHIEMYTPILGEHPFLYHLLEVDGDVAKDVCHEAMSEVFVKPGHDLLEECQESSLPAFYLRSGVGTYTRSDSFMRKDQRPEKICGERWLCESTLWLKWKPAGRIKAKTSMQCVKLDAGKFRDFVRKNRIARAFCAMYAGQYRQYLLNIEDTQMHADVGLQEEALHVIVHSTFLSVDESGHGRTHKVTRSRSAAAGGWWRFGLRIPGVGR